jgi:hypothetical protein
MRCLSEPEEQALKAEQQRVGYNRAIARAELALHRLVLQKPPAIAAEWLQRAIAAIAHEATPTDHVWTGHWPQHHAEAPHDIATL